MLYIAGTGWAAALLTGWLWLQARDAVIEEREGCNAAQLESALQAAQDSMKRQTAAHQKWRLRMRNLVDFERQARDKARAQAEEVEARLEDTLTTLGDVHEECLDNPADSALLDSLR
jgi:hypothetical protein